VNNPVPSGRAASCTEITKRQVSRKEVLIKILEEIDNVKKSFASTAAYSQGNRPLATEWNSLTDCIGARAAVFEPAAAQGDDDSSGKHEKILARGIFQGIDPAGRCIIKTDEGALYFNHGSASLAFLNG